ncbi:aspartate kinase [Petrotoga sp. 8T1HF07.NaAc.6.1]|jgi:aspartate kinase|uniref:aspartate kinase n=1 Tax=Petrotoga sp. 8T1HF07.NaAc.6.1 TaxID=1351838 RepID=UPI00192CC341|nr:aspartate kinase [Petrotoga sp. 8T1HF07.NaAc.6.1]MBL5982034.1 aspartate kinase [Petrotoga sp. 8T1HF07.NaAc.6.1]
MQLIVQKYGGSSLADSERLNNVAKRICNKVDEGFKVLVVVSARGETTNRLIALAKETVKNPNPRELDMLLATGEQISASLLSMILNDRGVRSKSMNAFQLGLLTTSDYNEAQIRAINKEVIHKNLANNDVLVITGFQGITEEGDLTTLGRGGSDTSAVALAASLKVKCEIYSNFAGIYTIDPKIYPNAKKLKYVTYDEMLEMAALGAKVLHPRSVEIAKKFNVELYCASSFSDEEGSYVVDNYNEYLEEPVVTGLSVAENQTQVTILNLPTDHFFINKIFEIAANKNLNIDMISIIKNNEKADISFSIVDSVIDNFREVLSDSLKNDHENFIDFKNDLVKISVVGIGMRKARGVASRFFKAIEDIPIFLVTTSEIKISCLIPKEYNQKAVENIAKEFDL